MAQRKIIKQESDIIIADKNIISLNGEPFELETPLSKHIFFSSGRHYEQLVNNEAKVITNLDFIYIALNAQLALDYKNTPPNDYSVFNETSKEWEVDDKKELIEIKRLQKALITKASIEASNQTFLYLTKTFNGGESSARAIDDVVDMAEKANRLLAANITHVNITDINDKQVNMSLEQAQILALNLANFVQDSFLIKQDKKVLIEAALTKDAVTNIVW